MTDYVTLLAVLPLFAWIYLRIFRGQFSQLSQRLPEGGEPDHWPTVAIIVPARNEADLIGDTVARLRAQDYAGAWRIIVVNDHSEDGTADAARGAGTTVIDAETRPRGWMGKVWAMEQGLRHLRAEGPAPDYVLFTDADISHPPQSLRHLVAFAEADRRDLVSLMVRLRVETLSERLLIPAFVFFFAKLFPFAWVNDPDRPTAAAAGGCMLVRYEVAEKAALMNAIHDQLIDDCALARAVQAAGSGRIWLGLTETVTSSRPYGGIGGVWEMVTRTAFTQLRHSPLMLLGSILGMLFLYLLPIAAIGLHPVLGLCAWLIMAACFVPALRLYGQPIMLAPLLPVAALLYTGMTIDSAWRHWRGRGGGWKGRYQS